MEGKEQNSVETDKIYEMEKDLKRKRIALLNFVKAFTKNDDKPIKLILIFILMILLNNVDAQNVVVTDDNTYTPSSTNALLEIKPGSNDKGILIPRLSTAQRTAISLHSTNDKGLMVYDTDTKTFWYYDGSAWTEIGVNSGVMEDADNDTKIQVEESADEDNIRFDVGGTEAMVVDENATIGIGTSNPSALLHLKGQNTSWDRHIRLENTGVSDYANILLDDNGLKFRTFSNGDDFIFRNDDNNTNFIIKDDGLVGLNTASPSAFLHIKNKSLLSNAHIRMENSTSSEYAEIDYNNTGLNFNLSEKDYYFSVDGTTNLFIKDDGKVGIGTINPSQKLEVNGNALISTGNYLATEEIRGINANGLFLNDDGGEGIFIEDGGNIGIGTSSLYGKFQVFRQVSYASESVDQQQTLTSAITSEYSVFWQSFTAGSTGYLSKIDVWDAGSSEGTFIVRIYEGEGTNGKILGESEYVSRNNNGFEYVSFVFNNIIPVSSGEKYTFALEVSGVQWQLDKKNSNPYSGGYVNIDGTDYTSDDTKFKTYVASSITTKPISFLIDDEGFVGVNTLSPQENLHVNGSVKINENLVYQSGANEETRKVERLWRGGITANGSDYEEIYEDDHLTMYIESTSSSEVRITIKPASTATYNYSVLAETNNPSYNAKKSCSSSSRSSVTTNLRYYSQGSAWIFTEHQSSSSPVYKVTVLHNDNNNNTTSDEYWSVIVEAYY